MRRALTLLAALALGATPLSAAATTVPTLTLAQQARKADVIVRATLGSASSVKEGDVTWLVYPLTVTETVAGDPASLPQREGKPALYLLSGLEGLPELRGGQEAFLLLYSRRLDSPVVGLWQGVYPIENGKVTRPASSLAPAAAPQVAAASPTAAQAVTAPATPATTSAATSGPTGTASSGTTPTGTASTGTATPAAPTPPAGTGSGTPSTTPAPAPTTPTPPATAATAPAPTAPAAGNTAASTASTPVPDALDAIETDPAKFRDALRAARGAR